MCIFRLRHEAAKMARARHSNILTITAVMTDATGCTIIGIVMPYLRYGSLDRSVKLHSNIIRIVVSYTSSPRS